MRRLCIGAFLGTMLLGVLACARSSLPERRLIILGFDGMDPELTERWMAEGKLPNLKALREEGSYRRLATLVPTQSPAIWSSFATGLNPGRTNIFGFLRRVNVGDRPTPEIAYVRLKFEYLLGVPRKFVLVSMWTGFVVLLGFCMLRWRRRWVIAALLCLPMVGVAGLLTISLCAWLPEKVLRATLAREGDDFWKTLGEKGIPCKVISAPISFPARKMTNCKMLTGLGTPDLKGTHGTWTLYSTEAAFEAATETGGVIRPVKIEHGLITTDISGPDDPFVVEEIQRIETEIVSPTAGPEHKQRLRDRLKELESRRTLRAPLRIVISPMGDRIILSHDSQTCAVEPRQWSRWVKFKFRVSPLITLQGMAKFYLVNPGPKFELFMSPLCIDPSHVPPTIAISWPRSYARELADEVGPYDTLGWSAMTNPLKDERLDYRAFTGYLWESLKQRDEMVMKEMAKNDWACFCVIFEEPDHVSHMMYGLEDRAHPAYNEFLAQKYGGELLKVYQYLDGIVGEVRRTFVDDRTALMIVSDHGFKSFRRSVNINTWLTENGYMTLRGEAASMKLADLGRGSDAYFNNVDWSKTKAYALDLGKIYINLRGREPQGIVSPGAEYEQICREIVEKFERLTDPESQTPVVHKVYRREEIYHGPYVGNEADLLVGFKAGYRVSWQTCLGGSGARVIEDNHTPWRADHCSLDPSQVPGVFFSNCKVDRDAVSILDIPASVLNYFQVIPEELLDGKAFGLSKR